MTDEYENWRNERETSRNRDGEIERLAEALLDLGRPRPIPRQSYELPIFYGDPSEWISYRNMYKETNDLYKFKVHENMARLRTSLQGDAKIAVEDLLRLSSNPTEVMQSLEEEFGHPNLVLALPKVSETGRELRKFSASYDIHGRIGRGLFQAETATA